MHSLSEVLLSSEKISAKQYAEAKTLEQRSEYKIPIEKILQRKRFLTEKEYLEIVSEQLSYPYLEKISLTFHPIFEKISLDLIEKHRVIPFQFDERGRILSVAMCSHRNLQLLDDLRYLFETEQVSLQCFFTHEDQILKILHSDFDKGKHAAKELMESIDKEDYNELEALAEDTIDLGNEAPVIRMVNAILTQAVQERATDIHIEPGEKELLIRYRIDGVLHQRMKPPKAAHLSIVSRIKIMSNLNIAENRLPQDGRIKLRLSGQEVDIRVSVFPTHIGERIVLRLLNKSGQVFRLDTLELQEEIAEQLRAMINETNGIVLVTGPTGSGKSTSLYAALSELNNGSKNILTAEDPVEYQIAGIGQMQIHEKIGLTFAQSLRAMLRQDPDVRSDVLVGEIRDEETARISIQAALTGSLTGHLVLSTLHTNDAPSSITRLVDMGIEPYLITSTVRGVLAQRLLRKICTHCRQAYEPSEAEAMGISQAQSRLRNSKFRSPLHERTRM